MSLSRSIAINTIIQISSRIVGTILAAVTLGLLTRYLGQEGFGAFTIATTFPQLFGVMADLGLSLIAIQMISENKQNSARIYHAITTLRIVTAFVAIILAPIASLFFPYPPIIKLGISIISISIFLSSLNQILTVQFQVNLAMTKPMIAEIASKLFLIVGILFAMTLKVDLIFTLWLVVAQNLLQVTIVYFSSLRYCSLRLIWDISLFRTILQRSWPIGISIICTLAYLKMDTIILSLYHSQSAVGIYGGAYRVFEVLATLPGMFMGLALASFSRAWSQGDARSFRRYFQKSFDFMMMAALPLMIGTPFIARPLMILVLGQKFEDSGTILRILILTVGISFFSSLIGHLINIIHKQKSMILGYLAGMIVGVGLYLITIPSFSYWGAAWTTVLTQVLVSCIGFFIFYKTTKILPALHGMQRIVLATLCMTLFLAVTSFIPVLARVAGAMLLYFFVLILFGIVPKSLVQSFVLLSKKSPPHP